MTKVKLINYPSISPLTLTKHAANICYLAQVPEPETETAKTATFVKNRLFDVGHHTTLQHAFFTFQIENIAIADITFGLHLTHPFYNSDQRSGRYCAQMFTEPDYTEIETRLKTYWPEELSVTEKLSAVMAYIRQGFTIYQSGLAKASAITEKFLTDERPNWSAEASAKKKEKIAQEQLRVFIPIIFPTALDFTINLSTLIAIWESAWTPGLREVTEKMKLELLEKFPTLAFMFAENKKRATNWECSLTSDQPTLIFSPSFDSLEINNQAITIPEPEITGPLDKLHFTPELMDNNITQLNIYGVKMSVATMGQDQRHRTIRRGLPVFTGEFYLPPIIKELTNDSSFPDVKKFFANWLKLSKVLPNDLTTAIAPYGAVVKYNKSCSINALIHEQNKRICWCGQEEIYNLSRLLREKIISQYPNNLHLKEIFEPPCLKTGRCMEGPGYCGRDISLHREPEKFFPLRKV